MIPKGTIGRVWGHMNDKSHSFSDYDYSMKHKSVRTRSYCSYYLCRLQSVSTELHAQCSLIMLHSNENNWYKEKNNRYNEKNNR